METLDIRPALEAQLGSLLLANIELREKLQAALAEIMQLKDELQRARRDDS